jgi:hypothetical protein
VYEHDGQTYAVRAAVSTKVRREGDSRTETKEDAQAIHGHVDNGYGELLDEGSGEEVEQREQPPYTHEESVVDDGVCAVSRTCDVVASHGCHDDGADELSGVSDGSCLYVVGDGYTPARHGGPWTEPWTPF